MRQKKVHHYKGYKIYLSSARRKKVNISVLADGSLLAKKQSSAPIAEVEEAVDEAETKIQKTINKLPPLKIPSFFFQEGLPQRFPYLGQMYDWEVKEWFKSAESITLDAYTIKIDTTQKHSEDSLKKRILHFFRSKATEVFEDILDEVYFSMMHLYKGKRPQILVLENQEKWLDLDKPNDKLKVSAHLIALHKKNIHYLMAFTFYSAIYQNNAGKALKALQGLQDEIGDSSQRRKTLLDFLEKLKVEG